MRVGSAAASTTNGRFSSRRSPTARCRARRRTGARLARWWWSSYSQQEVAEVGRDGPPAVTSTLAAGLIVTRETPRPSTETCAVVAVHEGPASCVLHRVPGRGLPGSRATRNVNFTWSRQPTPPAVASIRRPAGAVPPTGRRGRAAERRARGRPACRARPRRVVGDAVRLTEPPCARRRARARPRRRRDEAHRSQGRRGSGRARTRQYDRRSHGNARRAARVRARRQAADRQLRRPRLHALGERRGLRGAARRRRRRARR